MITKVMFAQSKTDLGMKHLMRCKRLFVNLLFVLFI